MKNKRKNIFLFLLIFCFLLFLIKPALISAKFIPNPKFEPQVAIPEATINGQKIEPGVEIEITPKTFAYYLLEVYKWGLKALALLAIVIIMVAGGRWIIAGGNASTIKQAKDQIIGALIGLLIGFGSYAILNFINPSLVQLQNLKLDDITEKSLSKYCSTNEIYLINYKNKIEKECAQQVQVYVKIFYKGTEREVEFSRTLPVIKGGVCGTIKGGIYVFGIENGGQGTGGLSCEIEKNKYNKENPLELISEGSETDLVITFNQSFYEGANEFVFVKE